MTNDHTQELTLTRVFNQPREVVFKGWTNPRLFAQWWGPDGYGNKIYKLEPYPGGAIYLDMLAPDGTAYPYQGEFHEVDEPEKLVFSGGSFLDEEGKPQIKVRYTLLFEEYDTQTKLTLQISVLKSVPELLSAIKGITPGMNQSLNRLSSVLTSSETSE
ncbi:Uncharacterized conserved protein YndB, AHSA1/START domain [Seinonella peptonophila]|uniref:Uncharacterized conserved protein YndB, AHSA1/START domain n=1 Tax=Seinonella peptonophila TaxID=112248 RepID=A0A1M4YQ84_9BACL|nr:SRPBCC domain-containing protein [Seinonella peptonophila]SHF07843.1 Uncharacterized conserved protein YndB, AHSA1/START domain [Seinonella peptonophila]